VVTIFFLLVMMAGSHIPNETLHSFILRGNKRDWLETFWHNVQYGLISRFNIRKSDLRLINQRTTKFQSETSIRLAANAVMASLYLLGRDDANTLQRCSRSDRVLRCSELSTTYLLQRIHSFFS